MQHNKKSLEAVRHSLSHILAAAILEKYPKIKLGIGPTIEDGFYYDFDFNVSNEKRIKSNKSRIENLGNTQTYSKETRETIDLIEIEKQMRKLIKQNLQFKKESITFAEAKKTFSGQPYKLELIKELAKEKLKSQIKIQNLSIYKSGNFVDLCRGPHVKNTKEINPDAFKLTKIAGAYWKGSEKNPMLTRIYGIAFKNKKELDNYLKLQEEAEKRDHRKLGVELELFLINDEVGQGLPIYLPKGAMLRHNIMMFALNTYLEREYQLVTTPHIGSEKLWTKSGHLQFYKENMYSPLGIEGENYILKPMNCPFHIQVYKQKIRSYRDLPMRLTEMGTVYRYERSGVLHGLTRVRGFTQDDGHIICASNQVKSEIKKALELTIYILTTFGFKNFEINLSVRNPKSKKNYAGSEKKWKMAENALKQALKESGIKKIIKDVGGAVFYGPKIDIKVKDAIGREWQLSTIQFDFNLPDKFEMFYIDEKNKKQTPFMIHRALLGSLDRFMGVYIEHTAGAFPLWLAPIQVAIIPISQKQIDYAQKIFHFLKSENLRVELKDANETLGKRIREGEIQKIPYLLIIGDKEANNKTVNIRHYRRGVEGEINIEGLIKKIKKDITEKAI
ncbi:MAG: threonine--tRNA ligase [Candidatus Liptonbacteria bacterium]|nr:threonine--tRNA ligase [Candidatus Liptonbacteria bacterium]